MHTSRRRTFRRSTIELRIDISNTRKRLLS